MRNIRDRLLRIIIEEGLNPNQFYEKTGLANGYLDKVGEKMQIKSINKIQKTFPHWNIDWLLTGEGEMLKSGNYSTASEPQAPYGIERKQDNDLVAYLKETIDKKDDIIKEKDIEIAKLNQEIGVLKADRVEPEKRGTPHPSGKTQAKLAGEKSPATNE